MGNRGQFQIQQMAFMIIAIFIFFAFAGLFILRVSVGGISEGAQDLKTKKAITFLSTIPEMTELSFNGQCQNCLDKDKLFVFSNYGDEYKMFFPLDSLKAFRVYPLPNGTIVDGDIVCPSLDCVVLFESSGGNLQEYATYVSVCEKSKRLGVLQEKCEVWKLVGGTRLID